MQNNVTQLLASQYEGQFFGGLKSGRVSCSNAPLIVCTLPLMLCTTSQGKYTYKNRDTYEGEYRKDKQHGTVSLLCSFALILHPADPVGVAFRAHTRLQMATSGLAGILRGSSTARYVAMTFIHIYIRNVSDSACRLQGVYTFASNGKTVQEVYNNGVKQ